MKEKGVTAGRREGSLLVTPDEGLPSFQFTFGAVTPWSLLLSAFLSFPGTPDSISRTRKTSSVLFALSASPALPQHAFLQPE